MDIVGKRWWFFALSAFIILPGMIFLIIPPSLKLGIDFTGGSSISVSFTEEVFQEDLRAELDKLGYSDALVQGIGENSFFLTSYDNPHWEDVLMFKFRPDTATLEFMVIRHDGED